MSSQLISPIKTDETSYFKKRMAELGITDEYNNIDLWQGTSFESENHGENILVSFQIFREVEKGIEILVYSIDRSKIYTFKDAQRSGHTIKAHDKDYCITRLETPIIKKDGDIIKYLMPKGHPTQPFFPPGLVAKYDKAKEWKKLNPGQKLPAKLKIVTLFMTEGYFKSFKSDMSGISCVGLSSITSMKNKETGALHEDIQTLLTICEVERFIWLTDGDCRDITSKDLTDGHDLYKRPWQFYKTVSTFHDLLSKFEDIKKYWGHIPTEDIEGKPKGIDDLLCMLPEHTADIVKEYNDFSQRETKGEFLGNYIYRRDITFGVGAVHRYFFLNDVDDFYLHHVQKRPEMNRISFKFNGSLYIYNEEQAKCLVKIPGAAERYFRVGDCYYEWVNIPNKFGETVRTYRQRKKETIKDDHGKNILQHIVKYHDFCVVPDHINYQPVKDNCFNKYIQLPHSMEKGDSTTSINFVKHIFGDKKVIIDNGDGEIKEVEYWELGLDYITILFKYPQQVLPILCLVSTENNTGKSTFLDWLNFIFVENMVQVGNEDLANPFNAYWTSKLIIACDETKVDKQLVFEKIKRLSTSGNTVSNGKGTNQESTEFFGKFIFCSNNEDSFVNVSARDIRFWVNKVKPFPTENVYMREELKDEIEAFLYFIYNRQMVTKNKARHWFDTRLLKTEALQKLIDNSESGLKKRIRAEIQDFFEMTDAENIYFPLDALMKEVLKITDKNYVKRELHDMGYKTETGRRSYPRRIEISTGEQGAIAHKEISIEWIRFNTTFYEFNRSDFTIVPANTANIDNNNSYLKGNDLPF